MKRTAYNHVVLYIEMSTRKLHIVLLCHDQDRIISTSQNLYYVKRFTGELRSSALKSAHIKHIVDEQFKLFSSIIYLGQRIHHSVPVIYALFGNS